MKKGLDRALQLLGSYEAIGRLCGVTGKAVMKWQKCGHLPRTEWTGETRYAETISAATGIGREQLLGTLSARSRTHRESRVRP